MADLKRARDLLAKLGKELEPIERKLRNHYFLEMLELGRVPRMRLEAFAGEQYLVIMSDQASFTHLAKRFPAEPYGEVFESFAKGEAEAMGYLIDFAEAVGMSLEDLQAYRPQARTQIYPAYVAWLAINGSPADVLAAFMVNLAAWGDNCGRMANALREHYGFSEDAVRFLSYFSVTPEDIVERSLAAIEASLREGASPVPARRAGRLLQTYELMFWDTFAEGLDKAFQV